MATQKSPNKAILIVLGIVAAVISVVIFAVIMLVIYFTPFQVVGVAMEPEFSEGEYVLAKRSSLVDTFQTGDVITFDAPDGSTKTYIKRVIGVPGDTITIENGAVTKNGHVLEEPYTAGTSTMGGVVLEEGVSFVVPEGEYIVLGDNREFSKDSREFGPIPQKTIKAKVLGCYFGCK